MASAADWFPYKAESTTPAFSADGKKTPIDYTPLTKASKKWDICVSFPHMKDAYWLGVDYGVIEEARRQGVKLQVLDAGGYTNLSKQVSQIEDCVARGANSSISAFLGNCRPVGGSAKVFALGDTENECAATGHSQQESARMSVKS